jgi:hypothetical protein
MQKRLADAAIATALIAAARLLTRQMKGELTIASQQGKGTTASVALPAA